MSEKGLKKRLELYRNNGDMYAFSQSARTLLYRLHSLNRIDEFFTLLDDTSSTLASQEDQDLLIDFVDHVLDTFLRKNSGMHNKAIELGHILCEKTKGSQRTLDTVEKIVTSTKNKDTKLSFYLGKQYAELDQHPKAYRCFILARCPLQLAEQVEALRPKLLKGEMDLFIARTAFELLLLKAVDDATVFIHHFSDQGIDTPILNFSRFLVSALGGKSQPLFRYLLVKYSPSIKRDRTFSMYLSRISKIFFGQQLQEDSTISSIIKDLFA